MKDRILLMAGDEGSAQTTRRVLEEAGFRVSVVSAEEALVQAVRAEPPDLVVLDVPFPGDEGLHACQALKDDPQCAHVPVLALVKAFSPEEGEAQTLLTWEADACLCRPLEEEHLLDRVRELLGEAPASLPAEERVRQAQEVNHRLLEQYLLLGQQHQRLQQAYRRLQEEVTTRESFVEMVIHDLRNPLGVIIGALEVLEQELLQDMPSDLQEVLHSAEQSALQMMAFVDNVLGIERLERGRMPLDRDEVDLLDLIRSTMPLVRARLSAKRLILVEHLPESLPPVWADWGILARVLLNLLDNAIKFTSPGGTITLSVAHEGEMVRVTVSDTGMGIAPQDWDRIFEKFERVHRPGVPQEGGSGLGLAFCKLAVEAHGGTIWVKSEERAGSQFSFTLPLSGEGSAFPPRA